MPAFKFRLTTLMRLREATRDERRTAFGEAFRAQQILGERIAEKREELEELRRVYQSAAAPGRLEVDRLVHTQRFELVLRSELKVMEDQALLLAEEVERRRLALVEADRQLRILQKLEEKQRQRFDGEQLRIEQRRLDEVAARPREVG